MLKSAHQARPGQFSSWPALLAVLLVGLAGCTPLQTSGPETTADPAARQASALARQGSHQAAAEVYLGLAETTAGEQRQRYLILAAREQAAAGNPGRAQSILDSLSEPIAPANLTGWAVVAGDISLARGDARAALAAIERAPARPKPGAAAELLRVRGQALFRLGDPVGATSALLEREVWLEKSADIAANHQLLWQEYRRWGGSLTAESSANIDDPVLAGWLQLGYLAASIPEGGSGLGAALTSWQLSHQKHPANETLVPQLIAGLGPQGVMPERLALLLPLTGRQQLAGRAVRDGFMAGHYEMPATQTAPTIRIYDVDRAGVLDAYRRAVAEGAQFVVGPLLKESVVELAQAGITVPTLALNYLPDEIAAPAGLYQFALAPEDEASAAADRAIAAGQRRALALAPNNAWGRRLLNSFAETYQGQGGLILDYRFYDPSAPDFSAGIQNILLIGESRDRHDRLAANLGTELGFEPRRRSDIDLIFLASTDATAKLIRPQLKFYYAGDVPTYATSAVYEEGSSNNSDLNGIMFADMPWIIDPDARLQRIRKTLSQYWPDDATRRGRLYAMGFDAYRLVPDLASGTALAGTEHAGVTGQLYLSGSRQVHRRLSWARIAGGRPQPLQTLSVMGPAAPIEIGE